MTGVKWIKINTDMFDDDKIKLIEQMPEADTILIIWIKLLSQAGKTNASGYIYLNENIPFTEEMLSTIFNRPLATTRLALQTLKQFGMLDITDDQFISISNWEKHQNIEGLDKIREQTRKRVAKHRETKALAAPKKSNATVTLRNATEENLELELEEKVIPSIDYESEFNQFYGIYKKKGDKKRALASFKRVRKKYSLEIILNGTKQYMKQCEIDRTEKRFIKGAAVFLNGENFNDEFEVSGGQETNTPNYAPIKIDMNAGEG